VAGKVYNREEWKELLRAARNCQIVRVAVGWVDGWIFINCKRVPLHKQCYTQCFFFLKKNV
jgi:hypothetical protein